MERPFGRGPTTPGLGDLQSPWLQTTKFKWDDLPSAHQLANHLLIHKKHFPHQMLLTFMDKKPGHERG